METSELGLKFTGIEEGFKSFPYNDTGDPANATIGFGYKLHDGPVDGTEPAWARAGITQELGQILLSHCIRIAEDEVNSLVKIPLTQMEFDMLVDFAYNLGGGALARSTALKDLNSGDIKDVPAALEMWCRVGQRIEPGLLKRRTAEAQAFVPGTSTTNQS